jgi:hypothetical protein
MCATTYIDKVISDSIEKNIYHIPLTIESVKSFVDEVEKFISNGTTVDGIILDATGEAPESGRYTQLIDMLSNAGYDRNKILCIDSGLTFLWPKTHIILPWWMESFASRRPESILPAEQRTTLFLVLARIAKYHRVKLISKLVGHGLDSLAIMSCGSAAEDEGFVDNDNKIFDELVPSTIRDKFPIVINGNKVSRETGSTGVDDEFRNCLINVVLETGFENELFGAGGPPTQSWNRLFWTEKTDKCFSMGQIPVFLSKKGYVSVLRKMYGFDVFDDIVDHSYDDIDDPLARIDAVAQECIRLSHMGLGSLKSINGLNERFAYNRKQICIVRDKILSDSIIVLNSWLKDLQNNSKHDVNKLASISSSRYTKTRKKE